MSAFNYSSRVLGMSSEEANAEPSDIDRRKHAYFTLGEQFSPMSTSCSEEVRFRSLFLNQSC
jgi:hypothetical protein